MTDDQITPDGRLDPNSNSKLVKILEEAGITRSEFTDSGYWTELDWGRIFNSRSQGTAVFVLRPGKGTGVASHENYAGGILTFLGSVVDFSGNLDDGLVFKYQDDRRIERFPDEVDRKIYLSPGGLLHLPYASAIGDQGVFGGIFGFHNRSDDVPVAALLKLNQL